MKTVSLSAAVGALALVATSSVRVADAKKCQAKAFFSRDKAYHSGIVFVHGKKTHDVEYGTFQGTVNYTDVKTPLLNNDTIGYDKNASAYGWGSVSEFGFLGNARDYLFGLQLAMGSIAGLMTPDVEKDIRAALMNQDTGNATPGSAFPALEARNGAALNVGIQAVVSSTQQRIKDVKEVIEKKKEKEEAKDKKKKMDKKKQSKRFLQEREIEERELNEELELEERDNDSDDGCDDAQEDDNHSSKSAKTQVKTTSSNNDADDSKKSNSKDSKNDSSSDDDNDDKSNDDNNNDDDDAFTNPPSAAAVYRPPWGTARPVYFYGQCDHCHNSTGYTSGGHGKFQSCTLIYQGKEYKGKVSSDKSKHMCDIDFECE